MAPLYIRAPLPVSASYAPGDEPDESNAQASQNTSQHAADMSWREYFVDPSLRVLIKQALDNNRDLRMTVLRVQEARAAYGIQRADQYPAIGVQAGVDRSRVPADLNVSRHIVQGNEFQVGLGLASWEIDFWGRVRSLKNASLETYLASEEAQRAATLSLIAQTANSHLALRELDERIALAEKTTISRTETLRIFARRVDVGSTSRLNLTQVQTLLTQAQALSAELKHARAAQLHALTLLAGAKPELPTTPTLDSAAHLNADMLSELQVGLPSDLLTERPDIVAAEHQLKATHANIGAARAAFFPRVTLTASYGTASAELSGLFDPGSTAWIFSPSISLPIFDGGRRRNNLSLTEARRDIAVANYEKAIQEAFRDVSDALSARRWLTEELGIAQAALAAQTERARLSQLRYDNGASPFLDVLDAQRDLLTAEQELVQVRRALLSSRVGLYAALGGGSMRLEPTSSSALPAHATPTTESTEGSPTP